MASRRLSKQDMRQDQFRSLLSEVFVASIRSLETHWKFYLAGLAVVVASTAGAFAFWIHLQDKRAERSHRLNEVIEAFAAPVGPPPSAGAAAGLNFADEAKKSAEVEKRLKALEAEGSGGSGSLTVFYRAVSLAREGKAKEAVAALEPAAKSRVLAPLALPLRGGLHETLGDYAKAEADFKALSELGSPTLPKGEGLWQLGQYYERRGEKAKALEAYRKLEEGYQGTEEGEEPSLLQRAKKRVEALKGAA
jgi:tetratricopeptide (TPR) repeat protein